MEDFGRFVEDDDYGKYCINYSDIYLYRLFVSY